MSGRDETLRVMTDDHGFRVIAAETTRAAAEVLRRQKVEGPAAKALAELVTAVVLMRETMAPDLRVQGILKGGKGRGTLVGDSFPEGEVRGLAQLGSVPVGQSFSIGEGALLQMMRTLANGSLQQGIVDVATAGGVGEAFTAYLQESEQLVCIARVASRFEGDQLVAAGGYVVQVLPEAERPVHLVMTQRLEDFPSMDSLLAQEEFSVKLLVDELVYGMPSTELARGEVRFGCRCSETSMLTALASLPRSDIQEMIDDGKGLEIACDYCGSEYDLAVERLRALLATS
jgi:molecular chaperone Hsp33